MREHSFSTSEILNRWVLQCVCVYYLECAHIMFMLVCNVHTLNCSMFQDFPSIYQVREKLIENNIITVFAVTDELGSTVTQDLYLVSVCVWRVETY